MTIMHNCMHGVIAPPGKILIIRNTEYATTRKRDRLKKMIL
jgi:hypothetical protein